MKILKTVHLLYEQHVEMVLRLGKVNKKNNMANY